jgi:hypothetical protein
MLILIKFNYPSNALLFEKWEILDRGLTVNK